MARYNVVPEIKPVATLVFCGYSSFTYIESNTLEPFLSSDLKAMAKVTTAVLILRKGKSAQWTDDLDSRLISWTNEYINWLETATIAVEESIAPKRVISSFRLIALLNLGQQQPWDLLLQSISCSKNLGQRLRWRQKRHQYILQYSLHEPNICGRGSGRL